MREDYYFCSKCGKKDIPSHKLRNNGDKWYHVKNSTLCGPIVLRKRKVRSRKNAKKRKG